MEVEIEGMHWGKLLENWKRENHENKYRLEGFLGGKSPAPELIEIVNAKLSLIIRYISKSYSSPLNRYGGSTTVASSFVQTIARPVVTNVLMSLSINLTSLANGQTKNFSVGTSSNRMTDGSWILDPSQAQSYTSNRLPIWCNLHAHYLFDPNYSECKISWRLTYISSKFGLDSL
jgi:hypothetical protein